MCSTQFAQLKTMRNHNLEAAIAVMFIIGLARIKKCD